MIGRRFQRLTILSEAESRKYPYGTYRRYNCLCDCGAMITAWESNLKRGGTKSCGCYKKESAGKHSTTHNMSHTSEYEIWAGIKKRCTSSKYREFHLYGGRGIQMCEQWLNSFEAFYADMGKRPEGTSIDRINNDGNYEPSNCRWATPIQQAANTRKAIKINYGDCAMTLRQLAITQGVDYFRLYNRAIRNGEKIEAAIAHLKASPATFLPVRTLTGN